MNKRSSCVQLLHKPTGIQIKCMIDRSQKNNRSIARQLLREKLDEFYNGEESIANQRKRVLEQRSSKKAGRLHILREKKRLFKENLAQVSVGNLLSTRIHLKSSLIQPEINDDDNPSKSKV